MNTGLNLIYLPRWALERPWPEVAGLILLPYIYIAYQWLRHRRENELFRIVSENAADMIALVEVTGKRLYNSPAYEKVLGYSLKELAASGSLEQVHPEDRERVIEAAKEARLSGVGKRLEYRMRHKDGNWRVLESTASAIRNRKGQVTQLVIVNRDITERKRIEERLEHEAFHDVLTGLPNRSLFLDRLQRAMDHGKRHPEFKFAVLFVDIQGLKIFNETMGHAVVDQLIIDISKRLKTRLRHDDTMSRSTPTGDPDRPSGDETLARMDGDRFTVLLENTKAPSDPMRVAMRVQQGLAEPFTANGVDAFTSASIGIALSSPSYQKPGEMLRDADIAMCRAKTQGRSGCEVFDTEMHALVVKRLKLETELRKAIEHEELRVFYQPIIHLSTGKIAGVEALVRWWHNESEMVGPGDFIEVAEETGLIVPIGRWVIKEACRQAHAWHLLFNTDPLLTTTINVSPRQFAQSNLVADVKAALDETGVAPSSLQFEITETMAMSDPKATNRIFSQLKDIGVRLSIDDFGTGHSSLSRLRSFPVDVLKIDRSFVRNIEHDGESREIVQLIVTLAHHLNLKVIAEGIETPGQCAYLKQFGCEFGQGYLYSRPVDQAALQALLASVPRESSEPCVTTGSPLAPAV
ncbi:MAG: EAL domain-containing protein [Candidatus Acidiferrales bacterium]|jgi:PAS domain S-box-containing protein